MERLLLIIILVFFVGQASYLAFDGLFRKPDKIITVRFKEVPPLIKFAGDISVYYRGFKVGKATCKKLSADQKYILFCLRITYKDLELPVNTKIILKTQDVFGDRYFDLIYPDNPSEKLLASGDVIDGTAVYERLDKYLVEEMENGELGELISNLTWLTGEARTALGGGDAELKKLSGEAAKSMNDISAITKELRAVLADPQVQKDIKTAISYAPKSLKSLNALLAQDELQNMIKSAPQLLDKTVTRLETVSTELPHVNRNMEQINTNFSAMDSTLQCTNGLLVGTNGLLGGTNGLLSGTNCLLGDLNPKIPVIPQELVTQADKTLKRYDCIGAALSDTMSKRALLLRLMFGKPGESFENCNYPPCSCPPYTTCPDYYYYYYP
ncbi:MAG: hypothetical protein GX568_09070 [Candidatus Gastranaerophilales bacterium]|nr:hypothetical protein [Candidatus Gastranaerophilales bacterium]